MRKIRGNQISMIFQEPMTSLNPVFTSATRSRRPSCCTRRLSTAEAASKRSRCSSKVGIPSPEKRVDEYPAPALAAACASG